MKAFSICFQMHELKKINFDPKIKFLTRISYLNADLKFSDVARFLSRNFTTN